MVWDKKGITPLMATLLLISFAVAVGVVIMSFGKAQVEEEAQCPINIGLHFAVVGGKEDYCYDEATGQIRFTIENGVNIKVSGIVVNIIGTNKAETFELHDAHMEKAGSYVGAVEYNALTGGAVRQMKISPKIILYDEEQICMEKALVVEELPLCE